MSTPGYLTTLISNLAPERFIAFSLCTLLVWGAINSVTTDSPRLGWATGYVSIGILSIVCLRLIDDVMYTTGSTEVIQKFDTSLSGISNDVMAQFLKLLMVFITLRCFRTIYGKVENDTTRSSSTPSATFEYAILMLLALLGMMFLVSAEDLRIFYLALELQSLALYVLAAYARGSAYSTEAGLKYFMLGAFASGLYLLGASLIYGYLGTTNYNIIGQLLNVPGTDVVNSKLYTGFILVVSAISFKLAAAPFHRWSPDVIEGSPSTSSRFFASVSKIAALGALIRLTYGPFYGILLSRLSSSFAPIPFRSGLSMVVAAVAALGQRRIKRFLAYSAIGHRGFRLMGLSTGTYEGLQATLIYLVLYVVGSLGIWSVVVTTNTQYFTDLGGLSRRQPAIAIIIAISMFSRAGVPPRSGFLAKLSVLAAARQTSNIYLPVIAIMVSVVGAYYYLRIIKIRYFSEGVVNVSIRNKSEVVSISAAWVMSITTYITVFILLNPTLISTLIQRATLSMS